MLTTHRITPAWIQCMANQVDSVRIHWKDSAHDEDNYRVERRIGSGVWEEVATADRGGRWRYRRVRRKTGVDTSAPNRFYRVRAYRSERRFLF